MDAIVLFTAVILAYGLLRMRGGKGVGINIKLAPLSTPEGKKDRLFIGAILVIFITALAFVAVHDGGASQLWIVLVPVLFGALAYLGRRLQKRS